MSDLVVPFGTKSNSITWEDSDGNRIAKVDYDNRTVELGGYNHSAAAALVVLEDGHGRQMIRLNAETGNITVGGLNPERNQDGDIILQDKVGKQMMHFSASDATATIGGKNGLVDGVLKVKNGDGVSVVSADGERAFVSAGAVGHAGQVRAVNDDGKVTAGLDGASNALLLRSPNGTIFKITVSNNGTLSAERR